MRYATLVISGPRSVHWRRAETTAVAWIYTASFSPASTPHPSHSQRSPAWMAHTEPEATLGEGAVRGGDLDPPGFFTGRRKSRRKSERESAAR